MTKSSTTILSTGYELVRVAPLSWSVTTIVRNTGHPGVILTSDTGTFVSAVALDILATI